MLKLAVAARMPLVAVHTDDTVNIVKVVDAILGLKTTRYAPTLKAPLNTGAVYLCMNDIDLDYDHVYGRADGKGATIIVVNPSIPPYSGLFDAGVVTPPDSLIEEFVAEYGKPKHRPKLVAALAGLSYEQMFQVSKLAMAKHGTYTPESVRDVRRSFFGTVRGLQMLPTGFSHYDPAYPLTDWLKHRGRFLTEFEVPSMTPRGALYKGPPGTGKTLGAKYIARSLGLPLYLLDISGAMDKYHGESERILQGALAQVERSAPCVMLIDEVEKLFTSGSEDSGVTNRILSSILWWLQEHQSKVFTIMTTNSASDVPPELFREGRIDSVINFTELRGKAIGDFALPLADKLMKEVGLDGKFDWDDFPWAATMSHAQITERLKQRVAIMYLASKDTEV